MSLSAVTTWTGVVYAGTGYMAAAKLIDKQILVWETIEA